LERHPFLQARYLGVMPLQLRNGPQEKRATPGVQVCASVGWQAPPFQHLKLELKAPAPFELALSYRPRPRWILLPPLPDASSEALLMLLMPSEWPSVAALACEVLAEVARRAPLKSPPSGLICECQHLPSRDPGSQALES